MYTRRWSTSEPTHDVVIERDVKVKLADGTHLDGNDKWGQTPFVAFALHSQMRKMGSVPIYFEKPISGTSLA
jgi:hypothetical protein